jgi:hypothetical protein
VVSAAGYGPERETNWQEGGKAAEQIVAEFQQSMQEVMDNLEAQMAFDDLSGGHGGRCFVGWVGGWLGVGWVGWCVGAGFGLEVQHSGRELESAAEQIVAGSRQACRGTHDLSGANGGRGGRWVGGWLGVKVGVPVLHNLG